MINFCESKCKEPALIIGTSNYCKSNIVVNPLLSGDLLTNGWTFGFPSVQIAEDPAIVNTAGSGNVDIRQTYSGTLEGGLYAVFWRVRSLDPLNPILNWEGQLSITGSTTVTLWQNEPSEDQWGSTVIQVATWNNPQIKLELKMGVDPNQVLLDYFYICPVACEMPETPTDFCFQLPMFDYLNNLFQTDSGCISLESPIYTNHTEGIPRTRDLTVVADPCPTAVDSQLWDTPNIDFQAGDDGKYHIKWRVYTPEDEFQSISWGQDSNGVIKQLEMHISCDANDIYIPFSEVETEGCFVTDPLVFPLGAPSDLFIDAYYERNNLDQNCRIEYQFWNTDSYTTKLWFEVAPVLKEDTFYRLKFTLGNVTGVTVFISDSLGNPIFTAQSDSVSFDKIFNTGTLPVPITDQVFFRFEVDDFIDCNRTNYWEDFICEVSLYQQCQWDVQMLNSAGTPVDIPVGVTQTTMNELQGVSYNPQIRYCQSLALPAGEFNFEIVNDCDISNKYLSQPFKICETTVGLSLFSWDHCNVKCVGNSIIDKLNYDYLEFFWIRADIQELILEEEREVYRGIDGRYRSPYVFQQGVETLQLWSMAQHIRRAVAIAMSGDFIVDGVLYQKINDDEIEPLFQLNPASAIRVKVHRADDFAVIRSCIDC